MSWHPSGQKQQLKIARHVASFMHSGFTGYTSLGIALALPPDGKLHGLDINQEYVNIGPYLVSLHSCSAIARYLHGLSVPDWCSTRSWRGWVWHHYDLDVTTHCMKFGKKSINIMIVCKLRNECMLQGNHTSRKQEWSIRSRFMLGKLWKAWQSSVR